MLNSIVLSFTRKSEINSTECSGNVLKEIVVIPSEPNQTEVDVDSKYHDVSRQVVGDDQFVYPGSPLPASLDY